MFFLKRIALNLPLNSSVITSNQKGQIILKKDTAVIF